MFYKKVIQDYNIKIFLHIRKAHMNYTTLEKKVCNF